MIEVFRNLDYRPLYISIKTAVLATIIVFFVGIFLANVITKKSKKSKMIWDSILTLPMVLPPTVIGFFLLILFSLRRPVGEFLYTSYHIKIVQTWAGCVIAAVVVSFPLMYRSARGAFEQVNPNVLYAARTIGMSNPSIFWKVLMAEARPGIVSGAVLTFARALGEYGATSMLAGNIEGKTGTIAQVIAMVMKDGDYLKAWVWAGIMMLFAFAILTVMNLFGEQQKQRIRRTK